MARVVTWPGTVAVQASEAQWPSAEEEEDGEREGRVGESEEAGADGSSLPCTTPATYHPPDPRPHVPNLVGLLD